MSRWIDADKLIEHITNTADLGGWIGEALQQIKKVAIKYINLAPSIDIVPRKAVKGYEGYYEVDMYGRVYSVERTVQVNDNGRIYDKPVKGRELSQADHTKGYKTVSLTKGGETKTVYVHRIVAEAYIPNPQNLPFINHKDEDKTNNFVTNLEWCTSEYNTNYGTARERQAEKLRGRSLTEEHKEKIRQGNLGKHHKPHTEKERASDDKGDTRYKHKGIGLCC